MKKKSGLGIYCVVFYAFLYLPLAVIFAFSFNDATRNVVWRGFTFKWYLQLLRDRSMLSAFLTSVEVGLSASVIASILGFLISFALARKGAFKGRGFYVGLMSLPLMMPEIVMGVGLLSFFVRFGFPLTFWTLACAHAMIAMPYTSASIRSSLLSMRDSKLEEAAMDLGASPWQAFWKIILPLTKPAIISGALLAFTISFEDFVTSFFIAGIGIVTLPIKIYSMMKFGVTPEINALAVALVLLTLTLLLAGRYFSAKKEEIL